ncbi:MAG: ribonuclease HII [Halieaceae bacterium]|jgi:ribonuclease HII
MPEDGWQRALATLPAHACIVGVDEVGRGPLAGDVVAGAVVLGRHCSREGLADSKTLSARRRAELELVLHSDAQAVALGRATPGEIDQLNILQATLLAMRRAVEGLGLQPDLILVDGNRLPDWSYRALAVVRGDARVPEIAAASIVAKVQRDREMVLLDARWPDYGFAAHKGYPTARHLEALRRHGVTPQHRRSFAPVRAIIERDAAGGSAQRSDAGRQV